MNIAGLLHLKKLVNRLGTHGRQLSQYVDFCGDLVIQLVSDDIFLRLAQTNIRCEVSEAIREQGDLGDVTVFLQSASPEDRSTLPISNFLREAETLYLQHQRNIVSLRQQESYRRGELLSLREKLSVLKNRHIRAVEELRRGFLRYLLSVRIPIETVQDRVLIFLQE